MNIVILYSGTDWITSLTVSLLSISLSLSTRLFTERFPAEFHKGCTLTSGHRLPPQRCVLRFLIKLRKIFDIMQTSAGGTPAFHLPLSVNRLVYYLFRFCLVFFVLFLVFGYWFTLGTFRDVRLCGMLSFVHTWETGNGKSTLRWVFLHFVATHP